MKVGLQISQLPWAAAKVHLSRVNGIFFMRPLHWHVTVLYISVFWVVKYIYDQHKYSNNRQPTVQNYAKSKTVHCVIFIALPYVILLARVMMLDGGYWQTVMVCQLEIIGRLYGLPIGDYWQTVHKICRQSANNR